MTEYDTTEYEPKHARSEADQKLMDFCLVAGGTIVFLIGCALIYLGVEAIRYDIAYISPIFFVVGGGIVGYLIFLTKVEDYVRDFKAWRERKINARR